MSCCSFGIPILLKSEFKKINDFVSVEVVESAGSASDPVEEPVKHEHVRHAERYAADAQSRIRSRMSPRSPSGKSRPLRPMLQEKQRRLTPMAFTPQSQSEDLAALKNPDQIQAPGAKVPNMPVGGPTLSIQEFWRHSSERSSLPSQRSRLDCNWRQLEYSHSAREQLGEERARLHRPVVEREIQPPHGHRPRSERNRRAQ